MRPPLSGIHNDDDHGLAMAEIERLWGAPEGSPEADQLEVLVTLVDAYEREHHSANGSFVPLVWEEVLNVFEDGGGFLATGG